MNDLERYERECLQREAEQLRAEAEQEREISERSFVSDNLLVTVRDNGEVFISTHGTFWAGPLQDLLEFLQQPKEQDAGADQTSN